MEGPEGWRPPHRPLMYTGRTRALPLAGTWSVDRFCERHRGRPRMGTSKGASSPRDPEAPCRWDWIWRETASSAFAVACLPAIPLENNASHPPIWALGADCWSLRWETGHHESLGFGGPEQALWRWAALVSGSHMLLTSLSQRPRPLPATDSPGEGDNADSRFPPQSF